MLFNSFEFILIFLPIVLAIYFLLSGKTQRQVLFLTAASFVFYAQWDIYYTPLLITSILFNYLIGLALAIHRKKSLLFVGVGANLALLAYFKYTGFLLQSWNFAFATTIPIPQIVLPLGISFFTFTQTAYLVDAYRGETKGYTLSTYSLFVTIFPHLIAGPILYHKKIIPQFHDLKNSFFSSENMARGWMWFSIGLFKKVVIADWLAPKVRLAFDHADQLTFLEAWAGAVAYTLQLYFDFSGYSEMAVGLGLMLNFHLPINFRSPYKAASIIDFWRRWHITLSEFLKNYLYIPLGGNRHGARNKMRNLLFTMLLGGLWHGAGWTFVIWGGLHGVYLLVNHSWRKQQRRLPHALSWALTFFCVVIAWVFFRADTVENALHIVAAMLGMAQITLPSGGWAENFKFLEVCGISFAPLYYWHGLKEVVVLIALLLATIYFPSTEERMIAFRPNWKWLLASVILLTAAITGMNSASEFLYFQF